MYYISVKENEKVKIEINTSKSRSIEEPPYLHVTFDNGVQDYIDLRHFKLHETSEMGCNYLGHLRNNPLSSSVAVTGCLQNPEDIMEVTLISNHNMNKMFSVDISGTTKIIKNPFQNGGMQTCRISIVIS